MKETIEKYVQRDLHFAIVDEVDSILIDEARTPLIISGEADKPAELYHTVDRIMPSLRKDLDYVVDEKHHSVQLTDAGVGPRGTAARVRQPLRAREQRDPAPRQPGACAPTPCTRRT